MGVTLDLDPEHRAALPPGGDRFSRELAASLDPDLVRSVLLFGSVVTAETSEISDVDLLVVLEDAATPADARAVRRCCLTLSEQYLESASDRNALEGTVDRATGMFQSGFVAFESDVRDGAFHAVFDTNRVAYVLAPWRTVLASVFESTVAVYGESLSPDWDQVGHPLDRRLRELFRSFLLSVLLAVAQVPYALVSRRALQYAMEAHKWTFYNCGYHLAGGPVTLREAIEAVPDIAASADHLVSLRDRPRFAVGYLLLVPAYVAVIHARTALKLLRA